MQMAIGKRDTGYAGNEANGVPVTIYSTLELSDRVVVLGFTSQNLRKNPGGAAD